ncbi:VirB3 family type IV secretion system protein [Fusobacterium sp. HC1336]|uniref:VirB3 family type IV secretion system protein n=1 Tax=Fusobacterium sp. HC1336 TaxID=3171169 RepID=UPI003F1F498C
MARKRVKVDRSETAIPCMTVFTRPLQVAGLPRDIFFTLLGTGVGAFFILKNIIVALVILLIYIFLRFVNKKDDYAIQNWINQCRKKYISY